MLRWGLRSRVAKEARGPVITSRPSSNRRSFDVARKRPWNGATGMYDGPIGRHSDVYVFCLRAHEDKAGVDPLDLG